MPCSHLLAVVGGQPAEDGVPRPEAVLDEAHGQGLGVGVDLGERPLDVLVRVADHVDVRAGLGQGGQGGAGAQAGHGAAPAGGGPEGAGGPRGEAADEGGQGGHGADEKYGRCIYDA